jgi:hypothetical protein
MVANGAPVARGWTMKRSNSAAMIHIPDRYAFSAATM